MKLIAPNGFVMTKEMALAPFKDPNKKSQLKAIKNEGIQITMHGNYALVIMKTTHSFHDSNDRVYNNLQVFTLDEQGWKMELVSSVLGN